MAREKLMDDYNYHDWCDYIVKSPKEQPTEPHFAVVLFDTRTEWVPAYDSRDTETSTTVDCITYFALPTKDLLEAMVLRLAKANRKCFFFEVKKLGSAKLNVDVDLKV